MTTLLEITRVLYLFAPLLVAAALSGIVIRFNVAPWLYRPIDAGARFRGHRLFGDSKTWRGVACAIVGSVAAVAVQRYLPARWTSGIALVDYGRVNPLLMGTAFGIGATAGELPNSFVKRQLGIAPGGTTRGPLRVVFYLWDQLDLLTTTWPLLLFWLRPKWSAVAISIGLALAVHPLVALIGFLMGARKSAR
jgi:hypothetical protein